MEPEKPLDYESILEKAIIDLLDLMEWKDVQRSTGLPEQRCKEILALHSQVLKKTYPDSYKIFDINHSV